MLGMAGKSDKLISDILQWTLTHTYNRVGLPAKSYIHQLCVDTGYHLEDLPRAMTNRESILQHNDDNDDNTFSSCY